MLVAYPAANSVDKANIKITIFIKLSSNLYFPTVRIIMQRIKIIDAIMVISLLKPNSSTAKPAVTIVTAA